MRNECKCSNPDGGGIKCPPQHLAICIRGKDKQCYGECVKIPDNKKYRNNFNHWLHVEVDKAVYDYALSHYNNIFSPDVLKRLTQENYTQGGKMTFELNNSIKIYVRFSYIITFEN